MVVHVSKWLFTRQPFKILSQIGYIHGCRCQHIIAIYTAAVPEQIQTIYTAAVCPHKIAIYTAAIQEPNRLHYVYTLLPGIYKKSLFTRQPFKSQIGYIHCCRVYTKIVSYTAAVQEPNPLYTLLSGVYIKLLFIRQPFKSKLGYIHCCRLYIHETIIYTAAVQEPNRL